MKPQYRGGQGSGMDCIATGEKKHFSCFTYSKQFTHLSVVGLWFG
jgi:hypothetical protein